MSRFSRHLLALSVSDSSPPLPTHKPLNTLIVHHIISSPSSEHAPFHLPAHHGEWFEAQQLSLLPPALPFSSPTSAGLVDRQRTEAGGIAIHTQVPPPLMYGSNAVFGTWICIGLPNPFVFNLCYFTFERGRGRGHGGWVTVWHDSFFVHIRCWRRDLS